MAERLHHLSLADQQRAFDERRADEAAAAAAAATLVPETDPV